jgi:DASH complex subunit DAM1
MAPAQPHHPLRRISTGSLSSLARSTDRSTFSPSGLDFLQPALTELADEAATLAHNVQQMNELHDALGTFNESFAAYLYALKMNAFCVEWPQAPDENSFARLPKLSGELAYWAQLTDSSTSTASSRNAGITNTHCCALSNYLPTIPRRRYDLRDSLFQYHPR